MIMINYDSNGHNRMANLADLYAGCTVILMGGAPTILEQPLDLLSQRGVLSAAINNSAIHFRPTIWFSGDHPGSYEPQILHDPRIHKFAPAGHAVTEVNGKPYKEYPGVYFYIQDDKIPRGDFLGNLEHTAWYKNTLFIAIGILYHLGIRRIILGGSDFEFDGQVYAHADGLTDKEKELNVRLYDSLVHELKRSKPVLEEAGLELLDCSVKSKLKDTYQWVTMEEAVALCLEDFPAQLPTTALPHGTKFAPAELKKQLGLDTEMDENIPDDDGMDPVL